jgi:hypothetical protein
MGRPPFDRLRAHFGALLAASLRGGGFRTFASKPQNGFAAVTNVARVCRGRKSAVSRKLRRRRVEKPSSVGLIQISEADFEMKKN